MNLRRLTLICACVWLASCGPNGAATRLVYEGQATTSPAGFEIWELSIQEGVATGTPVRLTSHAGDDVDANWGEAAARITFASDRAGNFDIYTMDADGSNVLPLTTDAGMDRFPTWEPNADHVIFASDRDGDFEIMIMEDTGPRQAQLTSNNCLDTDPAWSPNGQQIVFVSNCAGGTDLEIFVMNSNGTNPTRLTNRPSMDDFHPSWSPDGTRIVFESVPSGGSAHVNTKIVVMDANGANQTVLLTGSVTGDLVHPAWSPDGDELVVAMVDGSGDYNLYTMPATGGTPQQVADLPLTQWAPDWR